MAPSDGAVGPWVGPVPVTFESQSSEAGEPYWVLSFLYGLAGHVRFDLAHDSAKGGYA